MFVLSGALLVMNGLVAGPSIYHRSLGININLWWGMVLVVFGLTMLFLAYRAGRSGSK
jgi:hypothetical protein